MSEVLGRLPFNTAAFHGWYEARATGRHLRKQMADRSSGKVLRRRKSEGSAAFLLSNKL